ncbi:putative bifunctional diguanylate cyclase/phosphodiesterase [Psychromonas ossibalaenae]|uniref:putative bifunctional diguanylate cyclase/phosphodiesterase n=1 Tax=Psychromonas ossibalaenae TaxID=444922 RepID=UPI00037D9CE6|nr:bifunctional diguanylate cyclase/phosphodiesterase [Psychromonas ossibalaenae]
MAVLAMLLVAAGVSFLLFSLKPAVTICRQDNNAGWKILLMLIICFLFGYLLFLYYLYGIDSTSFIENSLAIILFGGSIFVMMVINLSLKSIRKIQSIARQERHNSLHDSLTGLANRKHFLTAISDKVEQSAPFSVFILDLNGFKQINDMLGHYYADQVLIKAAAVIKRQLPEECFFSRIGGDQFTLISSAVTDENIRNLMTCIHLALKTPFNINSYNLKISMCCGGSVFPENSNQIVTLLQQADNAMSEAKKRQVGYITYNDSLDNDAKYRLEISSRLHNALAENQFQVHYQPLINVKAGRIHHFEALIRWPAAEGGFIPPDKFIPIAEQNNLIRQITICVLNNICDHLQELKQAGLSSCIHINLSTRDLQDDHISVRLAELINQGRILAKELVLEVTETAVMNDISATKTVLMQLSRQGFLISLDDFGTGYSSLSILLELPIHQIKIDRSFVTSMQEKRNSRSIVQSIILLAHNLGCTVVAEGVETKVLVDELTNLKCDYLQGYYYSKPLPVTALIEYCRDTDKMQPVCADFSI